MAETTNNPRRGCKLSHLLTQIKIDRRYWHPPLKKSAILAAVLLIFTNTLLAIELRAETIAAFDKFIASVETRLESRFSNLVIR